MKVIHEFDTHYHLWIEQGNKYFYLCSQTNKSGAGVRRVLVSAKEAQKCIEKGTAYTDRFMTDELTRSVWRANA